MRFDKVITLISEVTTKNDFGQQVVSSTSEKEVFASVKSVVRSEFYQSVQSGYAPKITFEVRTSEYNGASKIKYADKYYRVIRDFSSDGLNSEIVCEAWS